MQTESFNKRLFNVPSSCVTKIEMKKFDVKTQLDENGIAHSQLVERNFSEFLDVPFRDYSMQTFVATGEVTRLKYVSPIQSNSLDVLDRIGSDADEVSARLDHMALMEKVAESARESSSDVESK